MSTRLRLNKSFSLNALTFSAALLLVLFTATFLEAGFFSWKDEDGKTHFTDDLSKVPHKFRNKEGLKKHSDVLPSKQPAPPPPVEPAEDAPYIIDLEPLPSGNYLVEALLNGKVKAKLILDTGASILILSEEMGRKLGIRKSEQVAEMPTHTAGGVVWIPLIALKSLKVGDAEGQWVEAGINDNMGEIDGLLGMNFLGDYRVEVDHKKTKMILKPHAGEGEPLWNNKPGSWWKGRFNSYEEKIKSANKEASIMRKKGHPFAHKVKGLAAYYENLRENMMRLAIKDKVPAEFMR